MQQLLIDDDFAALRSPWLRVRPRVRPVALVDLGADAMTIQHPALRESLEIHYAELRAFEVDEAMAQPRRPRDVQLFRIVHDGDGGHPLEEPPSFLGTDGQRWGTTPVAMASIDLGTRLPNVALLFTSRRAIDLHAPPSTSDDGWVPAIGGTPSYGKTSAVMTRWRQLRTIHPPGLYLRVLEGERLGTVLEQHGVRRHFTCDDWSYASGRAHP